MDVTSDLPGIDAILFDKDGTLFDFRLTWEGWAAGVLDRLSGGDAALARRLGNAIGFDGDQGFSPDSPVIAGTAEEVTECLVPHLPDLSARDIRSLLDAEAAAAHPVPATDLPALLADLDARGLVLGVMTNDSESVARAHLAAVGIADRFRLVIGADSGFGAKPDPEPLLAFANGVGVAPARVLMVGDSSHDLSAARAAGMRAAAVLTGIATQSELAPLAEVVLPDIGDLPGWLAATRYPFAGS